MPPNRRASNLVRTGGVGSNPPVRTPVVSVVLPAFNAAQSVGAAVESIRAQTLADWELLAVDDGSEDDTAGVLKSFARRNPRMRVLVRRHHGIVSTLNDGMAAARGRFIARMDTDDTAHPERLAEQASFLDTHPDVGVVGSLVDFGGDRGRNEGYALHVDWLNSLVTPGDIELNRFVESPFAHPSVMFRRELIALHGGYRDGDFPEDYELWLRWLDAGVKMAKVPRALLTWNDPAQRLSRTDTRYDAEPFYRCKAPWLARWLATHVRPERRLLVWGAGRPTRKRAELLVEHGVRISGYVDIDPEKIGRSFSGRPVFGPAGIPAKDEIFVLCFVAKRGARELARQHLRSHGFVEGRDFLAAA
jgi:glycosyltransferase involved in cell wall biosynthesis